MTSFPFAFTGAPSEGPWARPTSLFHSAYMRGGAAGVGDVLMQDYTGSDTLPGSVAYTAGAASIGLASHVMANVIAPSGTGILVASGGPYFGVALRAAADDTLVRLQTFGYCTAFVIAASGSTTFGAPLVPTTAKNLDLVVASNERTIASSQEVMTTPTTRTLGEVLFNGVAGFVSGKAA